MTKPTELFNSIVTGEYMESLKDIVKPFIKVEKDREHNRVRCELDVWLKG